MILRHDVRLKNFSSKKWNFGNWKFWKFYIKSEKNLNNFRLILKMFVHLIQMIITNGMIENGKEKSKNIFKRKAAAAPTNNATGIMMSAVLRWCHINFFFISFGTVTLVRNWSLTALFTELLTPFPDTTCFEDLSGAKELFFIPRSLTSGLCVKQCSCTAFTA